EDNLVQGRIEVGVDRLRRHVPLGAVNGPADARELATGLKLTRALDVVPVISAADAEGRVIAKFVRVTDLPGETVEFRERFRSSGAGHPIDLLQPIAEDRFQIPDQLVHPGAGGRREIFFDVEPAEGFADGAVDDVSRPLPARLRLLRAAQGRL